MIYQPGIKVFIQSGNSAIGMVDVSEDLTSGTMQRRSDGVSSFQFTLSNPRRKYDRVFAPNDRIVVMMKRIAWVRVFTGLLNSVPLVSAWPREVQLTAACSLKRLQYWFWDAHSQTSQQLVRDALVSGGSDTVPDGGVANVILSVLKNVVGWPETKVHIGAIPADWFTIAYKLAQQVDTLAEQGDALAKQFASALTAGGVYAGVPGSVAKLADGSYAGINLAGTQCRIAEAIFSVGKSRGGSNRDVVIALIAACAESSFQTGPAVYHKDADSVGPFQMRTSMGWGDETSLQDPSAAAGIFFTRLLAITTRDSTPEGQVAQSIERSGFPDRYQKWVPMANAICTALTSSPVAPGGAGGVPATGTASGSAATAVAAAMARINTHNVEATCLIVVQSYFGQPHGYPRAIDSYDRSNTKHPGDTNPPAGVPVYWRANHVALSIGGGNIVSSDWPHATVVGQTTISELTSKWGLTYMGWTEDINGIAITGIGQATPSTGAGVGTTSTGTTVPVVTPTTGADAPGYNPNNPFDKLFGNNSWAPSDPSDDGEMRLSESLTGIRALLNDQPLLPFLKNSFYSTMRSYCSAPNGDLIAWFPDYYGIWGTAAKMVIEPIELLDFNVTWADDEFVTHQFTIGGHGATRFDVPSGNVTSDFLMANGADIRSMTLGIASIDISAMMYALFGVDATPEESAKFTAFIYDRFGARPAFNPMPGLQGPVAELFSAVFMFMRQWAYQYNSDVQMTFMPELWPGMLLQVPAYNFQAYITAVTHTFSYGQGPGFHTTVNIAAPARLPKAGEEASHDNVLIGLPAAGGFRTTNVFHDNQDIDHYGTPGSLYANKPVA